ncbi:hypothetical protein [Plasticicumulans lactativorans]|uniref:hypothetical protein n=1 Tax=Plasticicumulans lactativorans TaxID=1133106 RepID=UPI00104BEC49|nr:hypothetical protein [Plasticicumulans lactativorans]
MGISEYHQRGICEYPQQLMVRFCALHQLNATARILIDIGATAKLGASRTVLAQAHKSNAEQYITTMN